MIADIKFHFIIECEDYHFFDDYKKLLVTLTGLNFNYLELDGDPYCAYFFVGKPITNFENLTRINLK